MKTIRMALLLSVIACTGCSLLAGRDSTSKLLLLEELQVEPKGLRMVEWRKAWTGYKELLDNTNNDAIRSLAMKKMADLELEKPGPEVAIGVGKRGRRDRTKAGVADYAAAISKYEYLLKTYPDNPTNDQIFYQLGRAYDLSGDINQVLRVMTTLVADYPKSSYANEAQLRRAEILFALKSFPKAEKAYQYIVDRGPNNEFYQHALYMHGWSVFKQIRLDDALISFFNFLDPKMAAGGAGIRNLDRILYDDVLRVVSLSFSFQKGEESIAEFFDSYGHREYEFVVYERLADLYLSQKRFADAVAVYKSFINRYPDHARNPIFIVNIMNSYQRGRFRSKLVPVKAEFVNNYGKKSLFWKKHPPVLYSFIEQDLIESVIFLARHYHAKAQRSKKPEDYQQAGHWYREFIQSFPEHKKIPEMTFLYAESLFENGNYEDAAMMYEKIAYDYSRYKKSAVAGYAALLAYQKQIEDSQGEQNINLRRLEITSGLRFADTFKYDPRVPSVLLRIAEELFDLQEYTNAVAASRRLLEMPVELNKSAQRKAWGIIAHSEFKLHAYDRSEQASLKVLEYMSPADANRKVFEERLAAAIYKQGEQARDENRLEEASEHFLRIAKHTPTTFIRATADYDAGAALITLKKWAMATSVMEGFLHRYPNHELTTGAREKLAYVYEHTEQWTKAANNYNSLADTARDPEHKRELHWRVAELYEKDKQYDKAVIAYKKFITLYADFSAEAMEARYQIAEIYKASREDKMRHYWLKEIIEAQKSMSDSARASYLAARAALELATPSYQAFKKAQLKLPLKASLKQKKELMQSSIKAFTKAADYGMAEVTAESTYYVAEIYHQFSQDILKSSRPRKLDSDELEMYEVLLEEQAFPFEEKAIELHELNFNRVTSGIYNDWIDKSLISLAELRPVQYNKHEYTEPYIQILF